MGLLDRVSTLVRSNLNDLLDRAEDPEKVIVTLIQDMNNQLIEVKTQVASAIAAEKQAKNRWEEAKRTADEWQRKVELALDRGDDELAKQALQRRNTYLSTAAGLEENWKAADVQAQALRGGLQQLQDKIEEANAKKDLLIARHRAAKSQEQMHKTLSGIQGVGAMGEFDRLEAKVMSQEARANAYADLSRDSLDDKFQALETESEVNRQLREMKEARAAKALPVGDPSAS